MDGFDVFLISLVVALVSFDAGMVTMVIAMGG